MFISHLAFTIDIACVRTPRVTSKPPHIPDGPNLDNMAPTPKLGVLQLKTTFPRPPGDVGNPRSWGDIPVVIRIVEEADKDLVVGGGWGEELVDAFVREGERMIKEEGCVAFVTSCGFVSYIN